MYLTLEARNEDELMERALETLEPGRRQGEQPSALHEGISPAGRGLPGAGHRLRQVGNQVSVPGDPGDNDRRRELYLRVLPDRKFETIGAWRRQDGRNPRNGAKLAGVAGTAQCQRK